MRTAMLLWVGGLSLIVLGGAAIGGNPGAHAQSTTPTIEVGDLWFCDPSFENGVCDVTVEAGGVVEWQWVGGAPHTTTHCSDDLETCSEPREWDSSPPTTSGTFSRTFRPEDVGKTFLYRCQVHPTAMRGTITVVAATEPAPAPPPSPQASPEPTAEIIAPAPGDVQPTAVPSAGGPPPTADETEALWWLAIGAGGFLVASATVLALRQRR